MSSNTSSSQTLYQNPTLLILAASIGGFLCTVSLTILITLAWPFGNDVEQVFAGGMLFFILWSGLFYWIVRSRAGKKAWGRVLIFLAPIAILDIGLLLLGKA